MLLLLLSLLLSVVDFLFGQSQFPWFRKKGSNKLYGQGTCKNYRVAVQGTRKLDGRSGRSCNR